MFVIVAILLRSLIAPIYVIATVLLSYAFALGVCALDLRQVRPRAAAVHVRVPGRAGRRLQHLPAHPHPRGAATSTRRGIGSKTGGVITSAGLILAGTFCTLLATELESLFQVGFTVALGLLVDTFLIRIFLVPSIALLLRSRAL